MAITKKQIDELAALKLRVEALDKELKTAKALYDKALAPVEAHVNGRVSYDQGLNLRGAEFEVDFGKQRDTRKLIKPVDALLRLEKVQKGLGYANISIPLGVIDKHLRITETEGLFTHEYGARSIKVIKLS